ncbi:prevent-host-death protein [Streptomyces sp. NPDC048560]|uniref:prevent-host-death protein n=1 Tax=Streptomyces sp. NPDC048560 TaxID=3155488 RepID=UPI0034159E2C
MRRLWERFRRRAARSAAPPRFTGTLMQLIERRLVVVGRAGEPVFEVCPAPPARRKVQRVGRGSLRGRVRLAASFDEPPATVLEAFGVR